MYPAELGVLRVSRRVLFGPSGSLLVIDDLEAGTERTWTWLLHADQPATAKTGGGMLVRSGTGALTVHALPAGEFGQSEFGQSEFGQSEFGQSETLVTANPTSSTPSLVVGRRLHTLRREIGPVRSARFVSLLLPGSALEPTPDDQVSGTADAISWRHGDWAYRARLDGTDVEATARSGGEVRRIRASATEV
jgi:hypothetical protein